MMPGRLMVGRMALDHVVKVRVLPGQFYRPGTPTECFIGSDGSVISIIIPFLNDDRTLPVFKERLAMWNKLKVYST